MRDVFAVALVKEMAEINVERLSDEGALESFSNLVDRAKEIIHDDGKS